MNTIKIDSSNVKEISELLSSRRRPSRVPAIKRTAKQEAEMKADAYRMGRS